MLTFSETVEGHATPSFSQKIIIKKGLFNCNYPTDEHSIKREAIIADCFLSVGLNRESWQQLNHKPSQPSQLKGLPTLCHHFI